MKIYKAIPALMAEIDAIPKDRRNEQQGFKFRGIDDLYLELHGRFAKHGVFTVPEVLDFTREERPTKSGGVVNYTIARIKYTFHADDGSSVSAIVIGEGSDSGDKSANKSMSIAHKYALLQVFAIPTEDEKDPDFKSHEVAHSPGVVRPQAGPSPASAISAAIAMSGTSAGATVCPVGRNRGLRVDQLSLQELLGDVSYWRQREKNDGKPLSGNLSNYVAAAEAYTRAQGSQSMTPTVTPKQQSSQPVLQNADTPPSWVTEDTGGPGGDGLPF